VIFERVLDFDMDFKVYLENNPAKDSLSFTFNFS
jgi:hypothetical protein